MHRFYSAFFLYSDGETPLCFLKTLEKYSGLSRPVSTQNEFCKAASRMLFYNS